MKMTNNIVSVRIPKSLTKRLKDYAVERHYMDVSEVVRALLRKKRMEYRDPYSAKLSSLRKDLLSKVKRINDRKSLTKLIEDLDMFKKELTKKMGEGK